MVLNKEETPPLKMTNLKFSKKIREDETSYTVFQNQFASSQIFLSS